MRLSEISDAELIALLSQLVRRERASTAHVIEHLIEVDVRRLYLDEACESLSAFCIHRLGYSEDEAAKRVRVARLARQFPAALDELRNGKLHLSGLYLLARYVNDANCEILFSEARGKSKRQIETLIATRFPKPDMLEWLGREPEQLVATQLIRPGTGTGDEATNEVGPRTRPSSGAPEQLAPLGVAKPSRPGTSAANAPSGRVTSLSAARWAIQFTASAELHQKIERARELVSHALPLGELASLFERALDALIERETKRKLGAGAPRKPRSLREGSRHVPVEVARKVRERDGFQCSFVDELGRRCQARRFLTLEHRIPFALGGPATVENLCLFCSAHNQGARRKVFGDGASNTSRSVREKVQRALCGMGFREAEVSRAMLKLEARHAKERVVSNDPESMLRAVLALLSAARGAAA